MAALVIILTDCTWNLATGLGLRVGCIRKSTRLGHFEIHSFKARADKPQIATLPNKALGPSRLTVRDVVGMVLEMTGRARVFAAADLRDFLLIFRPARGSGEERLSDNRRVPTWLGANSTLPGNTFKALRRAWGWSNAPYTLDMIRPTALVRLGLTAGVLAAQDGRPRHVRDHAFLRQPICVAGGAEEGDPQIRE